ncbi:cyanate permease [Natranaerovirga hydrolytica]|uniref:Cyanate permease n=1 Tax=Natranaerovirga hydrolytica TaxID=680378 RepID=A0A4R1MHA4_9FIRM|nr:MFS transporter [Natranaerovirga hydrolytica]TCK90504.1 cyanate permease [Natranaerovirga hydrolytica]
MQNSKVTKVPFYYGWVIVVIAAIGYFFSGPGQTYSISIFINEYIQEFNWSRSLVSGIYSGATLCAGFLLFIVGKMVDDHGHKKVSIVITFLLAFACIWSSFIINPIMLLIGFFMLRLFGQGSMTLISSTLVPQWFIKKRAFALSLISLGMVIGSSIVPPVNMFMNQTFGWRFTWRIWGILLIVIFIPIVYVFLYNKPEDIGLLPDNKKIENEETEEKNKVIEEISWTLNEAAKTRSFWLMLFNQAVPSMISTGIIFHFVSILGENGLRPEIAAMVLSVMAVVSFPLTFIGGYVLDKVEVHYIVALIFIIECMGLLVLLYSNNILFAILYGVCAGIVKGINGVCNNVIWANYFGREHLASIRGVSMTTLVIGSALGPLPFGFAYDRFNGYREILMVMIIFSILGIIASLCAPKPIKKKA